MQVVGITGTNGKTTTSYLLQAIFETAGTPCGLMGTVAYRIGDREIAATRTTPEAPDVQLLMRQMLDAGCRACVMEALSVIIQVASFKLTGQRVFKMAPIHHHFELIGWSEPKVIARFLIMPAVIVSANSVSPFPDATISRTRWAPLPSRIDLASHSATSRQRLLTSTARNAGSNVTAKPAACSSSTITATTRRKLPPCLRRLARRLGAGSSLRFNRIGSHGRSSYSMRLVRRCTTRTRSS